MVARILLVEDNPDNMTLMDYLLTAGGEAPMRAYTGADGVAMAADERPDLILLDIHMPDTDGYAVAASVRNDPRQGPVRIVAVTAFGRVGDQERIIAAGFDGYIGKPITPQTFVREVEQFIPGE